MKLIDESSEFNIKEAEILVKVALLRANASPSPRPIMSKVVSMLDGRMTILDMSPEPCTYSDDLRFKAVRDLRRQRENQSLNRSQTQNSTKVHTPIKKKKKHKSIHSPLPVYLSKIILKSIQNLMLLRVMSIPTSSSLSIVFII